MKKFIPVFMAVVASYSISSFADVNLNPFNANKSCIDEATNSLYIAGTVTTAGIVHPNYTQLTLQIRRFNKSTHTLVWSRNIDISNTDLSEYAKDIHCENGRLILSGTYTDGPSGGVSGPKYSYDQNVFVLSLNPSNGTTNYLTRFTPSISGFSNPNTKYIDNVIQMLVGNSGEVYLLGSTGTIQWEGALWYGKTHWMILKFDAKGNFVWQQFSTHDYTDPDPLFGRNFPTRMAFSNDKSNIFVVGNVAPSFDWNNVRIVKLQTQTGVKLIEKDFEVVDNFYFLWGNQIVVDAQDNVFITAAGGELIQYNSWCLFVAKLDSNLNKIWVKDFYPDNPNYGSSHLSKMILDPNGDVIVSGAIGRNTPNGEKGLLNTIKIRSSDKAVMWAREVKNTTYSTVFLGDMRIDSSGSLVQVYAAQFDSVSRMNIYFQQLSNTPVKAGKVLVTVGLDYMKQFDSIILSSIDAQNIAHVVTTSSVMNASIGPHRLVRMALKLTGVLGTGAPKATSVR